MKIGSVILFLLIVISVNAQNDSLPYNLYRDRVVVHTSLAYKDAPFDLIGNFNQAKELKYRANLNLVHSVGVAYKWFAINLGYKLPYYLHDTEQYGKTNYFDVGFTINLKSWTFSARFHDYIGYGIENAALLSDTLPRTNSGYYLNNDIQSFAIGLNAYHFFNKDINMKAVLGAVGRYKEAVHGFYLRITANYAALKSPTQIIPYDYLDSIPSIYKVNSIQGLGVGGIPGYAYINNINGWQFGGLVGIGPEIQARSYSLSSEKGRGYLGLAFRFDLRLQAGYNVDNWFLMFTSSFDSFNIKFSDLTYRQLFYTIRLTYGYRIKTKKNEKEAIN